MTGRIAPGYNGKARRERAGPAFDAMPSSSCSWVKVHPLTVRLTHWLNVIAILIMVTSGWRIYNASPLFGFRFPEGLTLGGWLAGALQWHFAAMWLLAISTLTYLAYGISSGHYRRTLLPLSVRSLLQAVGDAVHGHLSHAVDRYNPLQRLAYLTVIVLIVVMVLSGLVLWKPTQFQGLGRVVAGYPGARAVHFFGMAALVLFVAIHVTMVLIVPRTFLPMWTGRARERVDAPP